MANIFEIRQIRKDYHLNILVGDSPFTPIGSEVPRSCSRKIKDNLKPINTYSIRKSSFKIA